MSTAMVQGHGAEEAKLTIGLPKPMKDWLERKGLERKQREGGRFGVAPILVELIEREMERERKA